MVSAGVVAAATSLGIVDKSSVGCGGDAPTDEPADAPKSESASEYGNDGPESEPAPVRITLANGEVSEPLLSYNAMNLRVRRDDTTTDIPKFIDERAVGGEVLILREGMREVQIRRLDQRVFDVDFGHGKTARVELPETFPLPPPLPGQSEQEVPPLTRNVATAAFFVATIATNTTHQILHIATEEQCRDLTANTCPEGQPFILHSNMRCVAICP